MKVVYTTVGKEQAEKLAERIICEKLAACVNFWEIRSVYPWKERIARTEEVGMIIKTENAERLVEWLKENHPYELPALLILDVKAEERFEKWVKEACG